LRYLEERRLSESFDSETERHGHAHTATELYGQYAESLGGDADLQSLLQSRGLNGHAAVSLLMLEPNLLTPFFCVDDKLKSNECWGFKASNEVRSLVSSYGGKAESQPGPSTLVLVNLLLGTRTEACSRPELLAATGEALVARSIPQAVHDAAIAVARSKTTKNLSQAALEDAALRSVQELANCRQCVLKWCRSARFDISRARKLTDLVP